MGKELKLLFVSKLTRAGSHRKVRYGVLVSHMADSAERLTKTPHGLTEKTLWKDAFQGWTIQGLSTKLFDYSEQEGH